MNDVLSMALAEAQANENIPEDKLEKIRFFGEKQRQLTKQVARIENELTLTKENLRRVVEQDLPEAMDTIGMTTFTLDDGTLIKVTTFYTASIKARSRG